MIRTVLAVIGGIVIVSGIIFGGYLGYESIRMDGYNARDREAKAEFATAKAEQAKKDADVARAHKAFVDLIIRLEKADITARGTTVVNTVTFADSGVAIGDRQTAIRFDYVRDTKSGEVLDLRLVPVK